MDKDNRLTFKDDQSGIVNKQKEIPVLFDNKENCCGCSACYSICPTHSISMKPDEEGFLYPIVDASTCIRCYKCISVCEFKVDQEIKGYLISK